MKRLAILLVLLATLTVGIQAQDKPKAELQLDLKSLYMWRGQDKGNVCIQPHLGLNWKGFNLSMEGSAGFSNDDYDEFDIILSYKYKNFTFGLLDEWGEDWMESRYFDYGSNTTHQFSGHVGYECKYGSLDVYTTFAGNDHKLNERRAYSTYVELNVPFEFAGLQWNAALGMTPYESGGEKTQPKDTEEEYFIYSYANQLAVCMLSLRATKEFDLWGYKLPVYIEAHGNPHTQVARLFIGVTLFSL